MKNLYVCEKCGKQFEDYGEANDCENSHVVFNEIAGEYRNDYLQKWDEGQRFPNNIIVGGQYYEPETEKRIAVCGLYKFVKIDKELTKTKQDELDKEYLIQKEHDEIRKKDREIIKALLVEGGYTETIEDYFSYWKLQSIYEKTFGSRYECESEKF